MRIRVRQNNTDIGSLETGDCFWHSGSLCMKVQDPQRTYPQCAYIVLATGGFHYISGDTRVERQDCVVVAAQDAPVEKDKWEV